MKKFLFLFCICLFLPCVYVLASDGTVSADLYLNGPFKVSSSRFYFTLGTSFSGGSFKVPSGNDVDTLHLQCSSASGNPYLIYFYEGSSGGDFVGGVPVDGSYLSSVSVTADEMVDGISVDVPSGVDYFALVHFVSKTVTSHSAIKSFVTYGSSAPEPTSEPPSPSAPVPSGAPEATPKKDLSEHDWKLMVYEAWTSENHVLSVPVTTHHVPYSSSNLEQHIYGESNIGVYGQVFSYRVKIPFRFECVDFDGIGKFDAHVMFDTEVSSGYLPSQNTQDMQVTFTYSTPWIESVDSTMSFDATGPGSGYPTGFDIHSASLTGDSTPEYYYCFDAFAYVTANHTFLNFGNEIKVTLTNVHFNVTDSLIESDRLPSDILSSIDKGIQDTNDTIKQEHQEEIDKSNEAVDKVTDGVGEVTDFLSSWEIITMPVKLVGDFIEAIKSDGSTGLTFPSFSIKGQQLWPSYTFDLAVIAEKFPVLYNSLHIVSGILVVIAFIRYLWLKWAVLFGDDIPEEDRYP